MNDIRQDNKFTGETQSRCLICGQWGFDDDLNPIECGDLQANVCHDCSALPDWHHFFPDQIFTPLELPTEKLWPFLERFCDGSIFFEDGQKPEDFSISRLPEIKNHYRMGDRSVWTLNKKENSLEFACNAASLLAYLK